MAERYTLTVRMPAVLMLDGWAGRRDVQCTIVAQSRRRVKIELGEDCRLPGRLRNGVKGAVVSVPLDCVKCVSPAIVAV